MDAIGWLAVCAVGLIAMGTVLGAVTARQIRRFLAQVREDERRAAEEWRAAQESDEGPAHNKDESGAKL